MNIFTAQNITKHYASHVALDEVSFSVKKQSIFGLLGPNGAGKTTCIRIINQIIAPDTGKLFFDGNPLHPDHAEKIGYLPEERGLYKKMKVGEQALYLAQLKGLSKAEALKKLKELFEKFEIEKWWNKKVEELSKGMQQKIQFIVTILHQPKLLIFDEPFSGFDPINTDLVKNEILKLRDEGATVIFSTHNMESVEELCDHIALIHNAKKILDGGLSEIKKTYKSNVYEIAFEGNMISFTNAMWAGYELINHKTENGMLKVQVKIMTETGNPNELLARILPHVKIHSFNEILPGVRDIFIRLVNEQKINPK